MAIEGGVLDDPEGKFKRSKDVTFVARHRNPTEDAEGTKGSTYYLHDLKQVGRDHRRKLAETRGLHIPSPPKIRVISSRRRGSMPQH